MVLRETFWQGKEQGQYTVGSCGVAVLMEYLHSAQEFLDSSREKIFLRKLKNWKPEAWAEVA